MKKDPVILKEILVEGMVAEGKCIARHEGKVIFIAGNLVAPGDIADLRIIQKKKNYLEAIPVLFHSYSKLRITPFCEHFGICGGCKWQHIDYETQLKYKTQQVTDNLQKIAKVALPSIEDILPAPQTQYYRNKLEFTFSNHKWLIGHHIKPEEISDPQESLALGFHIPAKFDRIVDIEHCYLQKDPSNEIRLAMRDFAFKQNYSFYDARKYEGFLRNLLIRTTNTDDLMVIYIVGYEDKEAIQDIGNFLKEKFPQITSLQYIVNTKKNDSFADLEAQLFSGKPYITEQMEDLVFRIGPKSFFQTNSEQAYHLYSITRDYAEIKPEEVVYDLYTGTGTIANFVARQAKTVIGLEYVAEAIEDAKMNSEINGIKNTQFFAGDIKDLLNPDFMRKYPRPDVIITDPPRAGMHPDVIEMLLQLEASRIVYVSCNPATQARDLALLDGKYKVSKVQPVDMFPQTHHVENIVRLDLK